MHNNPVLFQDKVAEVLSPTDGGTWALTPDRPAVSGFFHLRSMLDRMAPLRRELLQEFIVDHLGTHDELTSTEVVRQLTALLPRSRHRRSRRLIPAGCFRVYASKRRVGRDGGREI